MKIPRLYLSILLFLVVLISRPSLAQPPCASNLIAGDYCNTATPICNLNGYCGNTSAFYTATVSATNNSNENNTPLGNVFCGGIQNNSWLKFIADSTVAIFNVWCTSTQNNRGIQMQIYATTDCYNFVAVSNCWNPGYPTNGQIVAQNLTVGNTYYFMIDGSLGDVCNYVIACDVGVNLSPTITNGTTICAGNTTSLTAAGGLTYTWSSNPPDPVLANQLHNTTIVVSPTVTTSYTVSVTTGLNNFCTQDTTILTSVVNVNNVNAGVTSYTPAYCGQHNGTATVTGTGGSGTYTYLWNTTPAQTTPSVSALQAGNYTCTVTSAGCSKSVSVSIPGIPPPSLAIASFSHSYCNQSNGSATTQITGGTPPFSYYWNSTPPQTTANLVNVPGGSYSVTVTDSAGCTSTQSVTLSEVPPPVVSLSPLTNTCTNHAPINLSGGVPAGGTFSGPAVVNNVFTPATAGPGLFNIVYTYTDTNNCTSTATQPIQVYAPSTIFFAPIPGQCVNSPSLTLNTAAPAGGTYFGQGVVNGTFNPQIGVGNYSISYYYTNSYGCQSSAIQNVSVSALPVVTVSPFAGICVDASPQALSGGAPAGGTYSGPGVTNGMFNPSVTGLGTFPITYSYTDNNNCTNSATDSLTVYPVPEVALTPFAPICINVAPFQLSGGTPVGGTYIGPGVSNNMFTALQAGQGVFQIIYDYLDPYGCGGADTQTIQVNLIPTASLTELADICANGDSVQLAGGSPAGGYFTGPGVNNGWFNPFSTGSGTYTLGYVYSDSIGCSDTAFRSILVKPLPDVQFAAFTPVCQNDSSFILDLGTPVGGTYSGPGVSNTVFNPAASGAGAFSIVYAFTALNGCTDTASSMITVHPLPQSFDLIGGGTVCDGNGGLPVNMSGSQQGVEYLLMLNGLIHGFPFTGNGSPVLFGNLEEQGLYTIKATDPVTGCTTILADSVEITVIPSPYVELGDSMYLCDLPQIILDAGSFPDTVAYQWQDGSTDQRFTVTEPGTYWVKLYRGTCYGIDTVEVLDCSELEYPNVFTPNSDLKNDVFLPRSIGEIYNFDIEIYNRWGKMVYHSNNLEEGWNGKNLNNGEECSEGVYFYAVRYMATIYPQADRQRSLSGSVTLLR